MIATTKDVSTALNAAADIAAAMISIQQRVLVNAAASFRVRTTVGLIARFAPAQLASFPRLVGVMEGKAPQAASLVHLEHTLPADSRSSRDTLAYTVLHKWTPKTSVH